MVGVVVAPRILPKLTGADDAADAAREGAQLSAEATLEGVEKNIDFQTWLWGEQKDLAQPYSDFGESAIPEYRAKLNEPLNLEEDPGYQFGVNEGVKARDNSSSAKGMTLSGASMKAINRYGTDYGSTKYNEAFNRRQVGLDNLYRMITTGQAAASGQAAAGGQFGSQVSSAINTGASANAQRYSDIGNINAAEATSGFNTLLDIGNLGASYFGGKN
jgi:hypothetical protein